MKFDSQIRVVKALIDAIRFGREGTLAGARSAMASLPGSRVIAILARDIGLPVTVVNGKTHHDLVDPALHMALKQCLSPRSVAGALLALRTLLQNLKDANHE